MGSFLARRYAEPVEVVRGDDAPAQFLWRSRLYVVRAVLAHWVEAGAWWLRPASVALLTGGDTATVVDAAAAPAGVDDADREFWRVEAAAGRLAGTGVYDLCFDWAAGAWSVAAALD